MEIKEEKYDFIIKMVLITFIGSGLLYGVVLILSLAIKKPITLGESLSYFGAVLTAVVTIFGVMWQIQKNNEKIDEEKYNEKNNSEQKLKRYVKYIVTKNKEIYINENNEESREEFYKNLFDSLRCLDSRTLSLFDKTYKPLSKNYLEMNLDYLMNSSFGELLLNLEEDINTINKLLENFTEHFLSLEKIKQNNITNELYFKYILMHKYFILEEIDSNYFYKEINNFFLNGKELKKTSYYDRNNLFYDKFNQYRKFLGLFLTEGLEYYNTSDVDDIRNIVREQIMVYSLIMRKEYQISELLEKINQDLEQQM